MPHPIIQAEVDALEKKFIKDFNRVFPVGRKIDEKILLELVKSSAAAALHRAVESAKEEERDEIRKYLDLLDGKNTLFGYQSAIINVKSFINDKTRQRNSPSQN